MADINSIRKVSPEPNSIKLPETVEWFRVVKAGKNFAIDIGCSLTKVAYYSKTKHRLTTFNSCIKNNVNCQLETNNNPNSDRVLSESSVTETIAGKDCQSKGSLNIEENDNQLESNHFDVTSRVCSFKECISEQMSHLHFVKFQTKYIENCLDFIASHLLGKKSSSNRNAIKVTGGGVYKYASCIKEKLGVLIDEEDEMCCLVEGTNFLLKNVAKEAFSFEQNGNPNYIFQNLDCDFHPYLLVNIGTSVSIFKVINEDCYEKIGGLSTGGATFWGLGSLLTSAKEFDDLIELAEKGDYRKVDVLVKDIFGKDFTNAEDMTAASFGKINFGEASQKKFSEADIARSLLFTVLNSIGQVASLYAMMHNIKKVYFGGYFLCNNPLNMDVLSRSISHWSGNKIKAFFLRHEGYLGTVGAFLKGAGQWRRKNFMSSSTTTNSSENRHSSESNNQSSGSSNEFSICPLLLYFDSYRPDTVDLIQDEEAREYWLQCFEGTVEKLAKKAMESQIHNPTAMERANNFKKKFLLRLQEFKENPSSHGVLTVRSILDMFPILLNEFDFPDPYLKQKEIENQKALLFFEKHIKSLDELDLDTRHRKLILYLMAGNMFDWGAKEVSVLLETNNFEFEDALNKIPERPWLIDSLDDWIQRLEGPPHKCAAVFVDNSGLDIILGILPFVRELLKRGTEIILCSNSGPALNDVIHSELLVILEEVKNLCPIIKEAEESGRLIAMESGQTGPCLDLRRLKKDLCEEMSKRNVDLIVIEGMGRSVHTNLNTQFRCESLKVAVIKNRWLAQRLRGTMFSVLCQYKCKSTLN